MIIMMREWWFLMPTIPYWSTVVIRRRDWWYVKWKRGCRLCACWYNASRLLLYLLIISRNITVKKIPVGYFPPFGSMITSIHATAELGRLGIEPTTAAIADMMATMLNHRKSLKSWAQNQIQHMMCNEATHQQVTLCEGKTEKVVKAYKDITAAFKAAISDADFEKIWQVAFGSFDRKGRWQKELADTFMSTHGWEYILDNVPSNKRTYCVEQQVSQIKVDLIKGLNDAAQLTHGRQVRISRFPAQITEKTKYEKRTKAVFRPQYIASHVSTILILSLFVNTCTNNYHLRLQIFT